MARRSRSSPIPRPRGGAPADSPYTLAQPDRFSTFVSALLEGRLVLSPVPPGAAALGVRNPPCEVPVDISDDTERALWKALADGALPRATVQLLLASLGPGDRPAFLGCERELHSSEDVLEQESSLRMLGLCAVRVARAAHEALLGHEPFQEFHLKLTERARVALALGWEAIARLGQYPLPPFGLDRLRRLDAEPLGPMHFVSASDRDAGWVYTLGIALSPEAQALGTTNVSFGLDGELIVPGQAVSPIPPFLSLATRLFAAGIPTSSNISEEQHSIPIREFPQPDNYADLEPVRPGLNPRGASAGDVDEAARLVALQLRRNAGRYAIDAVIDVTGLAAADAEAFARAVLAHAEVVAALGDGRVAHPAGRVGLFLNVQRLDGTQRVGRIREDVDLAARLGLRHLAITDDVENAWLPGIHEYLDHHQVEQVARHADGKGVLVIDGRPLDTTYTASTALQRIQSVMTTLSVDILKLGMWLTLEANAAEAVWRQIQAQPAISRRMCLMPIGIVEPWSAFVDDRRSAPGTIDPRNPRMIAEPMAKIRFMIEEAARLGMPSLLTDTRHKHDWVLLGARGGDFPAHPREKDGTTSLLSWAEFVECERLARKHRILLGQAGSIEASQVWTIFSELTYDAAREARNPATAVWTAETERVLRSRHAAPAGLNLHQQRSAAVDPYLAVINRAHESHARLDGWLRFLAERHARDNPQLSRIMAGRRRKLQRLRARAQKAQEDFLAAAFGEGRRIKAAAAQAAWDACRSQLMEFHAEVKAHFKETRQRVANQWERMRVSA